MAFQVKRRNGTASAWSSINPILAVGEIGVTTDTGQFKIGNGVSTWNALSIAGSTGGAQTTIFNSLGDGSDGDVIISAGITTLTRDMFYNNLTINGTGNIFTNNYKIFVKNILDISAAPSGAINCDGVSGSHAVGTTGGTVTTVSASGTVGSPGQGTAGANGTAIVGVAATAVSAITGLGGLSNGAGGGGSGAALLYTFTVTAGQTASVGAVYTVGGNNYTVTTALIVTATSFILAGTVAPPSSGSLVYVSGTGTGPVAYSAVGAGASTGGAGGAGITPANISLHGFVTTFIRAAALLGGGAGGRGGASGGGDTSNISGGGGGGGNAGGLVVIYTKILYRTSNTAPGAIQASGGDGGNGGTASAGIVGGGGGGGGGAGGAIYLAYNYLVGNTANNVLDVSSGKGGNGGNAFGGSPAAGGVGGPGGNAGRIYVYNMTTNIGIEPLPATAATYLPEVTTGTAAVGITGGGGGFNQIVNYSL